VEDYSRLARIRRLCRGLLDLLRRRGSVWSGVYRSFAEVPSFGPGFDGEDWIRGLAEARRAAERSLSSTGQAGSFNENDLLAQLAALVAIESQGCVRILDFGGGSGLAYLQLTGSLKSVAALEYHIIESPGVCEDGRLHFAADARIHFHCQFPEHVDSVDIVYARSALQYCEDYPGVLRSLLRTQPRHVLLTSFAGTTQPTFATAQINLPGISIPYLFVNLAELVAWMRQAGYLLAYESRTAKSYRQHLLPPDYRMTHTYNLLFAKVQEGRYRPCPPLP